MPRIEVRIPTALRIHSSGRDTVRLEASTVGDALEALGSRVRDSVLDERKRVRPYVHLFLNQRDVRELDGLATRTAEGDVLHIIPAVAGGSLDGA